MSILIKLSNYKTELPKDKLYKIFPKSLLVTALELDGESQEIEITHSSVTPEILGCIKDILITEQIPKLLPLGLVSAGRYLNMELLEVIGDPKYDGQLIPLSCPSYDGSGLFNIRDILVGAIRKDYYSCFTYCYSTDLPLHEKYQVLTIATIFNRLNCIKYILREKDLNIQDVPCYNYSEFVGILSDEYIKIDKYTLGAFHIVIPILYYARYASGDVFALLLSRIEEVFGLERIIDGHCQPDIVNTILAHPKTKVYLHTYFQLTLQGNLTTVQLLFNQSDWNEEYFDVDLHLTLSRLYVYDSGYQWSLVRAEQCKKELDKFYGNYPESIKKSMYIAEKRPLCRECHDLYMKGHQGTLDVYDKYSIELLLISIQFGHIEQVKTLLELVKDRICDVTLHTMIMIATYIGSIDILTILQNWFKHTHWIERVKLDMYPEAYQLARLQGHDKLVEILKE